MHIKKNNSQKINYVIIGLIVLLIGSTLFIFIRHRLILKKIDPPPPPENTGATLTIKNFQHVATENGVRKWTLDAASASLYSSQDLVKLNDITVVFFMDNQQDITLTAKNGELNSQTNDMRLYKEIEAIMPPYKLSTDSLNYDHQFHIIQADTPVEIYGSSLRLNADQMKYDVQAKTIRCSGNVKGLFIENTP